MMNSNDLPEWKRKLQEITGTTTTPETKKTPLSQQAPRQPENRGHRGNTPPTSVQPIRDDSPDKYYLPRDTKDAISSTLLSYTNQRVENFALLLNKCALQERKPKKFDQQEQKDRFIVFRKDDERKHVIGFRHSPNFQCVPLLAIRQRHANAIRALCLDGTDKPFSFKVDWRLIVGLGNESVYETGMTLHHIYGIPYIPGQAVKGVLRSWIILTEFNAKESDALQDCGFCDIFGCPPESGYREARQGKVIFFDAFPTKLEKDSIQPDIMNPHYGPYYGEGKPPADYHNPVPVNFLTVQNTTFEFYVGIKQAKNEKIKDGVFQDKTPLAIVQEYLPQALGEHGIGAKTAVGYGYLSA